MNGTGNVQSISADTVPERTSAQWIIRGPNDNPWGPFETHAAARKWAAEKWPDIPEYDDNDGGGYWLVEPVKSPNDA